MLRIIDETQPTAKFTLEQLLLMHRQGVRLTVFESAQGAGLTVKAHDLGNGHTEVTAKAPLIWIEREWEPDILERALEVMIRDREQDSEERKETHLEISANRAKTKVRKMCKAMGADTLLTLVYHFNETDLQRSKKDLKEFVRRLRRLIPTFRAVAVYETQKRGALHWHLATSGVPTAFEKTNPQGQVYRVKSFDAIRAIWRSVVGERGGNIDLSRRKAHSQRSPARVASYISKYIVKAFKEGQAFSNRYSAFGDFDIPAPVVLGHFPSLLDALQTCYECLLDSQVVVIERLSHFKDWFVLHAEVPTDLRKRTLSV